MANKIQVKQGVYASLPILTSGEFGFSTDTKQLHIGDGTTNYEVGLATNIWDIFDANTILAADSDNTPTKRDIAVQEVVGRLTAGNIGGITIGIADNNMVQMSALAVDNDYAKFTTDGLEGRSFSEVLGDLSEQASANFSMNTKKIIGLGDPTTAQDGATKYYVDAIAAGRDPKGSCTVATTTVLPTCTPAGSKVGKTLTANANAILTIDGVATVLNDRILVKDQASGDDNGIYKVTTEGTSGVAFVLTRAIDFDEDIDVTTGARTFISEGTTNGSNGWVLVTHDPIILDTTVLVFTQDSGAGQITAGTGMLKDGNILNVIGGTGITANTDDIEVDYGTTGTTACVGNDARLSDARTPTAHKDSHDPNDGSDALDTAAAAEISITVGAGVGTSHSFSRADHIHAINHSIANNHIVTVDGTTNTPVTGDFAQFTTLGLEGKTAAELFALTDGANKALSNLVSVALNLPLLPDAAAADDFGSATLPFKDMFFAGSSGTPGTNNFKITGASTSGTRVMTFPNETGTVLTNVSDISGGTF